MCAVRTAADDAVIDALDEVWSSIVHACEGLDDAQWTLPTDCPGWTVRDQISHLIGIERSLLGDEPPPATGPVPTSAQVKNPFAEANERWVAARRTTPGATVLAEFVDVTRRRLEALRSLPASRFDEIGWSPVGQVPYRAFMEVRIFDCWVHEQDLRRALGRPGGHGGAGEAVTLDRMVGAMGFVVARRAAAPDGSAVVWRLGGRVARQVAVVVDGGRGRLVEGTPAAPSVELSLDVDTFWRLACGRVDPGVAVAEGLVAMSGDADLGRRVLAAMNVTP